MTLRRLFGKKDKPAQAEQAGSGAFLWFNRELIRDSGNMNYGRYIYRNFNRSFNRNLLGLFDLFFGFLYYWWWKCNGFGRL